MKKITTFAPPIIEIELIKSFDGAKAIQSQIISTREGQFFMPFFIKELSTNGIWEVRCIGNGNPWDCWITKTGTMGSQQRTFKRLYVQPLKADYIDL